MPVICKISLDAEEYRQKLAQVIAETKQAQAALSDLSDKDFAVILSICILKKRCVF